MGGRYSSSLRHSQRARGPYATSDHAGHALDLARRTLATAEAPAESGAATAEIGVRSIPVGGTVEKSRPHGR
ncbi:hypothetical protein [Streptomyces sp. MA5143a]|uniref:hypothetical protein n=1 Tax=Streptomyces sp. MA5143a TaxID=2083010 RepID=UPI0011B1F55E|nr:hypothetical protein [Streptomyces sp. MA5143a]